MEIRMAYMRTLIALAAIALLAGCHTFRLTDGQPGPDLDWQITPMPEFTEIPINHQTP